MTAHGEESEAQAELRACRQDLEGLDHELVNLLVRRLTIARRTAGLKRASGLPILDPQREAAVVRGAVSHARKLGVPEEPVREIFWHIVGLSRRVQEEAE
jgi:chorismate mutase